MSFISTATARSALGMDSELEDVREFHVKFMQLNATVPRMLTRRKLKERIRFMQEELDELEDAEDLATMFDALLDLVYVAKGTAVMMGLPWREGWELVHSKNMAKVLGTTHRGNRVDVAKPEGWTPPDHLPLLAQAGWALGDVAWADMYAREDRGSYMVDDQVHLEDGTAWAVALDEPIKERAA